jgi:predicted TIM-barrel fold metal-dependent hydrolase
VPDEIDPFAMDPELRRPSPRRPSLPARRPARPPKARPRPVPPKRPARPPRPAWPGVVPGGGGAAARPSAPDAPSLPAPPAPDDDPAAPEPVPGPPPSPVVDAHCHAGEGAGFDLGPGRPPPFARYLLRARAAGIDRTVVFAAFRGDYAAANREIARLARAHPSRLSWLACVHAEADRGRVAALLDEALRLGCAGVKVHRRDARITREICDAARARRLPILYDPKGEIDAVAFFARAYPEVPFVVPHLGSFDEDWRAQRALLDPLARLPNLHADTSGVRLFELLDEAVRRAGARKLLFGSDGPWLHPGVELAKVRLLRLAPEDERLVLGGNWERLFGARVKPSRAAAPAAAAARGR